MRVHLVPWRSGTESRGEHSHNIRETLGARLENLESEGKTVVGILIDHYPIALMALVDTPKENAYIITLCLINPLSWLDSTSDLL